MRGWIQFSTRNSLILDGGGVGVGFGFECVFVRNLNRLEIQFNLAGRLLSGIGSGLGEVQGMRGSNCSVVPFQPPPQITYVF